MKRHSEETRAAVLAALLAGQGVSEVARQYNLDPSVVSRWRAKIPMQQLQIVATKRTEDFSELLADYLREALVTLKVHMEFVRDTEWLKKQSASDIAVLDGVITDKALRLLEAAQAADEQQPGGDPEVPGSGA
jgi:transposase-like protein